MVSVKDIDALLPQTQCEECGFPGCLPYAEALVLGLAPIDRCPPGGVNTLKALGEHLGVDPTPYLASMESRTRPPSLAVIREEECIGCTKCIQACPVDAIIGSGKLMHSVLNHECTGCGLCVEPCPVDCIDMVTLPSVVYSPKLARQRFNDRSVRLLRKEQDLQLTYREKRRLSTPSPDQQDDKLAKQDYILQALARQQAKKSHE